MDEQALTCKVVQALQRSELADERTRKVDQIIEQMSFKDLCSAFEQLKT